MNSYNYDLHIHSCLSPCGDNDMTPANIAGMAAVKGLQIAALTDHNTTANCPAFFKACKAYGIIPVPGMELTVSEDIHLLCLFSELDAAMEFGDAVHGCMIPVKNRPDIFGHQYIMDEEDGILGEEENLLLNATTLSLEEGTYLCREHGGVCFPAHIERTSNGAFEISASGSESEMRERLECLKPLRCLKNSDAHYLWDISEEGNTVALEDEPYSGALVRKNLLRYIGGENDAGGSTI